MNLDYEKINKKMVEINKKMVGKIIPIGSLYLKTGIIFIILSFFSVLGFLDGDKIKKMLTHINTENNRIALFLFIFGFFCISASKIFSAFSEAILLTREERAKTFKDERSKIIINILLYIPLIIFALYISGSDGLTDDNTQEYLEKYKLFVFLFAGISVSLFTIKIIYWMERKFKSIYKSFVDGIPDSKDRLTIVVAFLGAIISLIALFK